MATLLDTNVLLLPAQRKIDVYALDNPFTLDACMKELERLARRSKDARLALDIAKEKKLAVVKTGALRTDDAIAEYAKKSRCKVATNDSDLIQRLKKNGITVIRLKQGSYLSEE